MKAKKLTLYALLAVLGMAFSYLESFIPLSLIVPGLKLGLANGIVLLLLGARDIKGAFTVNIVRICLSSLLFGTPMSFLFSLIGGVLSTVAMIPAVKIPKTSLVSAGVIGGATHNLGQAVAACLTFGTASVLTLAPTLCLMGAVCGLLTGIVSNLLINNKHIHKLF